MGAPEWAVAIGLVGFGTALVMAMRILDRLEELRAEVCALREELRGEQGSGLGRGVDGRRSSPHRDDAGPSLDAAARVILGRDGPRT